MKTQAHAPGPWRIGNTAGGHNADCICDFELNGVCRVAGIPLYVKLSDLDRSTDTRDAKGLANARLIASAPCLLAALQGMVATIEQVAKDHPDGLYLGSEYQQACEAIAKAKGGAQ